MYKWKSTNINDLVEEYQELIHRLAESYQAKLMELQQIEMKQAAGAENIPLPTNTKPAPSLVHSEMPRCQRAPEFNYPPHFWVETLCQTDREAIIYDGDRDKAIELLQDPSFTQAVEQIKEHTPDFNYKSNLLKTSFHLTPTTAPKLYQIGEECQERLGLQFQLDFYVYQDHFYNAYVYPPNNETLCIVVTSSLLESFDQQELSFIIGHEIGHYLFNHFRWNPHHVFDAGHPDITPRHSITLYQWKRDAEISADRVGLICCADFDVAARAFFKLSSGVKNSDTLDFQLQAYLDQFSDLKNEIENNGAEIKDLYTSHPFGPLRVKALELFWRSQTFHQSIGKVGGELTESQLEQQIEEVMNLMVPSYLSDDSEQAKMIQRFLFWGGIDVAEQDGTVDASELQALQSVVAPEIFQQEMSTYTQMDRNRFNPAYFGQQIAHEVLTFADKVTTHNMVRDLCLIALADGVLDEKEVELLKTIAHVLYVDPDFVGEVLSSAQADFN